MGKLRQKMVLVTMSKVIWPFFYLMVGVGNDRRWRSLVRGCGSGREI